MNPLSRSPHADLSAGSDFKFTSSPKRTAPPKVGSFFLYLFVGTRTRAVSENVPAARFPREAACAAAQIESRTGHQKERVRTGLSLFTSLFCQRVDDPLTLCLAVGDDGDRQEKTASLGAKECLGIAGPCQAAADRYSGITPTGNLLIEALCLRFIQSQLFWLSQSTPNCVRTGTFSRKICTSCPFFSRTRSRYGAPMRMTRSMLIPAPP